MTDRKLRWGILSTAKIGIKTVIPAIQQSGNGVVAAIASRDARAARETAQSLGIADSFGSYAALLESPDIDAVYNPLPNSLHKEWSIRAAEHGKHILCEKPFALNTAEVDEMIAAAKQHHVLLMEAFMYRFHPQIARVKELIASGAIGATQVIRSAFGFRLEDYANIRLNKTLGGGSVMDVGCYCVNVSRLIAGTEPTQVQANEVIGQSQVDEAMAAILRFPHDVIAHFDSSFRTDYREWLAIQGSEGRMELERPFRSHAAGGEGKITLYRKDNTHEVFTTRPVNQYTLMAEHFADAVLSGKPLQYPPELDRGNMRVIDALYESARTQNAVNLPAN
ncbi:MAG TPA: Gfo/Idh/MocA family oxidoreductase [Anaerolineae bacterium]